MVEGIEVLISYKWAVYAGYNKICEKIDSVIWTYDEITWNKENRFSIIDDLKQHISQQDGRRFISRLSEEIFKNSLEVKLLGITIMNQLNFEKGDYNAE